MPSRLIKKISSDVKVYYVPEWQEYQVKLKGHPEGTYYTDDERDAITTGKAMDSCRGVVGGVEAHVC